MSDGAYTDMKSLIRLRYQGRGFSFLPRQPIHSLLAGQKASKLRGRGLNFEEIRHYLPGDDIRSIDWKVTARMGSPHTRVYTEERDRQTLFVVDQRVNMFFGSERAMKSVIAAEAAALGAWRVLSAGDRVGAVVFNDQDVEEIRPHRSNNNVMRILEVIVRQNQMLKANARVKFQANKLNEVLARACRLAKHDALVCIISDFEGANDETKRLMNRLARHNDVLVGLVFDPLEVELPDLGQLIVGDGELQIEFNSGDDKLRQRFGDVYSGRLAEIKNFLLQRQIPLLPLHTGQGVAEQVRAQLGYRPRVAAR